MTEGTEEKVIDKIQKLLDLAARNPNEAEASAAAARAQELLTKHNLSTASLERKAGGGKRAQEEIEGGFYRYHRELWKEVAELNFCLHWVQVKYIRNPEERVRGVRHKRLHVLIGREVNVRTTINIARYLLAAVERVTRERCEAGRIPHLGRWGMSFREGCAYRVMEKLRERRADMMDEEFQKQKAAEERAARSGISTATALTISSHAQNEKDANLDFIFGEGFSAKKRAERQEKARKEAEEAAAYTAWAKANPEEARLRQEKEDKEMEKINRRYRGGGGKDRYGHVDTSAFWAGSDAGKKIGLDPQASDATAKSKRLK